MLDKVREASKEDEKYLGIQQFKLEEGAEIIATGDQIEAMGNVKLKELKEMLGKFSTDQPNQDEVP